MGRSLPRSVIDMPEFEPVRFGIIGCGSASIPVGEAMSFSALARLAAVHDVNESLAEDLSRRFQVHMYQTLDELLNDPQIDAVYIAVPHHLLASMTQKALEAGKHALTEKPLAITLADVDHLIALAAERGLTLGVFYEMRYASAHAPARRFVQDGAIGRIVGVRIQTLIDKPLSYWQSGYTGRTNNPWRGIKAQAGGGVVLMNTSHLLDALMYVTGLKITEVSAEVANLISNVEVEDMAAAALRFDNGAIGSLIAGAHVYGADREEFCHIYGTKGQIRLPDPYGAGPLQMYLKEAWGEFEAERWHEIPLDPVQVYQSALDDFARAVQCGRPAPVDAESARHVLSAVLSIYRSAAEKRTIPVF